MSFSHRFALVLLLCLIPVVPALSDVFQTIGIPVRKAGLMGVLVGPGPVDGSERIYFNFRQDGGKLFLVSVDPVTGSSEQYKSPVGTGAWGFIVGPDGRIYLGTHEGPDEGDSGQILVFDPKQPEKQIQIVGRPSSTETYLWQFCIGDDGKIYAGTYPGAKVVSFDPATGTMADHGVMDESQKYTRNLSAGRDGRIYLGIGYGKANVVAFDPASGTHESILPELYRTDPAQTTASVWKGVDGNVYVSAHRMEGDGEQRKPVGVTLKVEGDSVVEVTDAPATVNNRTLSNGTIVSNATLDGTYELISAGGQVEKRSFKYAGDGAGLFIVENGPLGRIYGGTFMPNEMFWYDPATGELQNPGNPSEVSGEIYSILEHNGLVYTCSYPGSFLSKWNPLGPWNYGREADSNPKGFGPLGRGHLRPRAMIHGPGGSIYIGSYPEYGMHGGSMAVWDPVTDTLLQNHHHLIKNQSIISLIFDEKSGLVFGGTSTQGGGGTEPIEPEAKFFAFSPDMQSLAMEQVPVKGAEYIRSMCLLGRRIYGIANADTLFIYNIDEKTIVETGSIGVGSVLDCSLRVWKDGGIYGVAKNSVFQLDTESNKARVLAEYPESIRCGMAVDDYGIYFGVRAELIRYNWPDS
ncbi:MAG: hypothetical protein AMXMBFR84_15510 [Candidatus Hydrogenedentota bacterium]